jgi:aerobic carbon-monoxide dehydrogenase medium subunit
MLPARFDYHRAESIEEALSLLDQYGDDAKVLAGGMSLIPLMKLRFASPGHLVDVNPVAELAGIDEADGWLRIGAMTRHRDIVDSDLIKAGYPALATAAPLVADPIVRNRGTIGGSLCHADPAGDFGSVLLALGAQMVVRSSSGERTVAIDDFPVDTFTTALEPNELLTGIRVPRAGPRSSGTYLKLERKVGDFATVGVAVQLQMDDGHVGRAGIGLTAVGSKNLRAAEAESALAGAEPTDEAFSEAGRLAAQTAQPSDDVRGSARYKRHVVEVFVRRGLQAALQGAA